MISRKLYEHKMAQVEGIKIYDGRNKGIDVYVCRKCGEIKYTIYGEKGVTPFCIGCKCGSSMQHEDTLPMWMSEVLVKAEKWVRPTYEQFTKLSIGMQEHVINYGLILESKLK